MGINKKYVVSIAAVSCVLQGYNSSVCALEYEQKEPQVTFASVQPINSDLNQIERFSIFPKNVFIADNQKLSVNVDKDPSFNIKYLNIQESKPKIKVKHKQVAVYHKPANKVETKVITNVEISQKVIKADKSAYFSNDVNDIERPSIKLAENSKKEIISNPEAQMKYSFDDNAPVPKPLKVPVAIVEEVESAYSNLSISPEEIKEETKIAAVQNNEEIIPIEYVGEAKPLVAAEVQVQKEKSTQENDVIKPIEIKEDIWEQKTAVKNIENEFPTIKVDKIAEVQEQQEKTVDETAADAVNYLKKQTEKIPEIAALKNTKPEEPQKEIVSLPIMDIAEAQKSLNLSSDAIKEHSQQSVKIEKIKKAPEVKDNPWKTLKVADKVIDANKINPEYQKVKLSSIDKAKIVEDAYDSNKEKENLKIISKIPENTFDKVNIVEANYYDKVDKNESSKQEIAASDVKVLESKKDLTLNSQLQTMVDNQAYQKAEVKMIPENIPQVQIVENPINIQPNQNIEPQKQEISQMQQMYAQNYQQQMEQMQQMYAKYQNMVQEYQKQQQQMQQIQQAQQSLQELQIKQAQAQQIQKDRQVQAVLEQQKPQNYQEVKVQQQPIIKLAENEEDLEQQQPLLTKKMFESSEDDGEILRVIKGSGNKEIKVSGAYYNGESQNLEDNQQYNLLKPIEDSKPIVVKRYYKKTVLPPSNYNRYQKVQNLAMAEKVNNVFGQRYGSETVHLALLDKKAASSSSLTPKEMKLSFKKDMAAISGNTINWLGIFAKKVVDDPSFAIEIRISNQSEPELQKQRLNLLKNILIGKDVAESQIVPVFTEREPDTLIIRLFKDGIPRVVKTPQKAEIKKSKYVNW